MSASSCEHPFSHSHEVPDVVVCRDVPRSDGGVVGASSPILARRILSLPFSSSCTIAQDLAAKTSPGGASTRVSMSGTSKMGAVVVGHHAGALAGPMTRPSLVSAMSSSSMTSACGVVPHVDVLLLTYAKLDPTTAACPW